MKDTTKPLDAAVVLAALEKEAAPLIRSLNKISIVDNDSYVIASQKVSALKQLKKMADEREKSLIDPLKKVISDIKTLFEPFTSKVNQLEIEFKQQMLEHDRKLEAAKEKVKKDLQGGKIAKLSTAARKLSTLELAPSEATVKKIWVLEEVDASLTPREYLVPNESKIKEALKAGNKVAGWKMVQKKTISI
jgi:hypothetical protein